MNTHHQINLMLMRQGCLTNKCHEKAWIRKVKSVKVWNNPRKDWCCSATHEKLQPLVISNAAHPLQFQEQEADIKHLPFDWHFNKKRWMIHKIFEEWLEDLNCTVKKQNQKILLLVDNATSHSATNVLS